jgi:hypothetical protein
VFFYIYIKDVLLHYKLPLIIVPRKVILPTTDNNHNGGVMVSVLASSAVDRGFVPDRFKPKMIKLVFVDFR